MKIHELIGYAATLSGTSDDRIRIELGPTGGEVIALFSQARRTVAEFTLDMGETHEHALARVLLQVVANRIELRAADVGKAEERLKDARACLDAAEAMREAIKAIACGGETKTDA